MQSNEAKAAKFLRVNESKTNFKFKSTAFKDCQFELQKK